MALQQINNGDTGLEAANKIYANDLENKQAVEDLKATVLGNINVTGTVVNGYYLNNVGVAVASGTWKVSQNIPIQQNKNYRYKGRTTSDAGTPGAAYAIVGYNPDGSFNSIILDFYNSEISGDFVFNINNPSIASVRLCSRLAWTMTLEMEGGTIPADRVEGLPALIETVNALQNGEADLTGTTTGAYLNSAGEAIVIGTWFATDFINVEQGVDYKYRGKTNLGSSTAFALIGYDENNNFVSQILHSYDSVVSGDYEFNITNPAIRKIRACSHNSVAVQIVSSGTIPADRVEGLPALIETVNELVEGAGVGPIASGKSWASIGDSITAFDQTAKGYQGYIKDKITFTSYSNQGYSGRSLTNAADRASILEGIANIGAFDIYTILVGTNDFKLNRPIGTTNDYLNATGGTTFYGALRATIDLLNSKRATCKIYIFTPLRRNNDGYTSFSTNTAGHKLSDYRDALEWVAKYEALTLLDLYNDSGITDRNLGSYTSDGLHPTTLGHELISKRMIEAIKIRI